MFHQNFKFLKKPCLAIYLGLSILLSGCGGGSGDSDFGLSYSGATTQAAIDSTSAKPLAETSTKASLQAVEGAQGNYLNPFGVAISNDRVTNLRERGIGIAKRILQIVGRNKTPLGVVLTADDVYGSAGYSCGGTFNVSDGLYNNTSNTGTITFNNACVHDINEKLIFNGTMKVSHSGDMEGNSAGSETITLMNFIVSYDFDFGSFGSESGVYGPINGIETCSWDGPNYANEVCSSTGFYSGSGGDVYKIQDVDVEGSDSSGWDVTATVYHPTYGYVDVAATGLTFNCSNGHPDSGHIGATGSGGTSISVDFTDCDTYSGSYNDGSGAVSFSGW